MTRKLSSLTLAVLLLGLLSNAGYAQLDGLFQFDGGGDGFSWDDPANWEQITDPNGNPLSGDPAAPPSATTSADLPITGILIDSSMPGQTALDVNVGLEIGSSVFAITGGDLTVRDFNIGVGSSGSNSGEVTLSGGLLVAGDDITVGAGLTGTLIVSGTGEARTGDDLGINGGSSVTVSTGGKITVGDRINMLGNAVLNVDGGEVFADDDFFFFEDSQITVNSGSMTVNDKLRFDDSEAFNGKLTINGGFVRANEFGVQVDGLLTDFRGVVEINGGGLFQVEKNGGTVDDPITELTLQTALALIAEGVHLTTSEPAGLGAREIIVPSFDGRTDVPFIEVYVVPEPASISLLGACLVGFAFQRKWSR